MIIIPIIYKYIGSMHSGICVRLTETKYLFQDVIFTKKQPEYTSESVGDSIVASCYNFNY
jgi:hypothetical protein